MAELLALWAAAAQARRRGMLGSGLLRAPGRQFSTPVHRHCSCLHSGPLAAPSSTGPLRPSPPGPWRPLPTAITVPSACGFTIVHTHHSHSYTCPQPPTQPHGCPLCTHIPFPQETTCIFAETPMNPSLHVPGQQGGVGRGGALLLPGALSPQAVPLLARHWQTAKQLGFLPPPRPPGTHGSCS